MPYSPSPNSYPPSGFASAVGNFLDSYGQVKGIQARNQDAADRKRASDDADRQAQIHEQEQGYTRLTMPTVGASPDQSWESKIGRFLHGGDPAPSTILMKTGPTQRETEIANAEQYQTGRDTAITARDLQVAGVRVAGENARDTADRTSRERIAAAAQSGENYRAGLSRATTKAALGQTAKHSVVDDAIDATGGYAKPAWDAIPPAVRKQYGLTSTDMNAGTQRFMDRKAALTREGIDARAANKGGTFVPKDLNGNTIADPAVLQHRADWDRAATAAKAQRKDPVSLLGPRP